MIDLIDLVNESRTEMAKGSKEGRSSIHNFSKKSHSKSSKSRIKVYNSITDALRRGYMGQMFSTKNADRIYVITSQKWGEDPEQIINGRSAKGFSTKTPLDRIKKYSRYVMVNHAGSSDFVKRRHAKMEAAKKFNMNKFD